MSDCPTGATAASSARLVACRSGADPRRACAGKYARKGSAPRPLPAPEGTSGFVGHGLMGRAVQCTLEDLFTAQPKSAMRIESDAHLARLLGLGRSSVAGMKKRGMPTDSLEAAQAWRDANLSLAHRKDANSARRTNGRQTAGQLAAQAVSHAEALGLLLGDALASGQAPDPEMASRMRGAMQAVPASHRDLVRLPVEVLDMLCGRFGQAVEQAAQQVGKPDQLTDDQAKSMGGFWFALAAGEPVPVP